MTEFWSPWQDYGATTRINISNLPYDMEEAELKDYCVTVFLRAAHGSCCCLQDTASAYGKVPCHGAQIMRQAVAIFLTGVGPESFRRSREAKARLGSDPGPLSLSLSDPHNLQDSVLANRVVGCSQVEYATRREADYAVSELDRRWSHQDIILRMDLVLLPTDAFSMSWYYRICSYSKVLESWRDCGHRLIGSANEEHCRGRLIHH